MAVIFRRAKSQTESEVITGTPGQTDFVLQTLEYIPGRSRLAVYINGLLAYPDVDYTIVDAHTVRLASPLPEEAELIFLMTGV